MKDTSFFVTSVEDEAATGKTEKNDALELKLRVGLYEMCVYLQQFYTDIRYKSYQKKIIKYIHIYQPLTGLLFRNFFEITSRNLGAVVRALGGSEGEFRCATTPTGL